MRAWELTPRDGLVLSDGRPFETGLAAPHSLPLPHPQTLAGLITTQGALDGELAFQHRDNKERALELRKQVKLTGPLLSERTSEDSPPTLLVPTPLDCVWSEVLDRNTLTGARAHRLTPKEELEGRLEGGSHRPLTSLTLNEPGRHLTRPTPPLGKRKPLSGPQYWRWSTLTAWLSQGALDDAQVRDRTPSDPTRFVSHLTTSARFHVALEPGTRSAQEGALFVTQHTNYHALSAPSAGAARGRVSQYSLTFWLQDGESDLELQKGVAHLGGEQRPSLLKPSPLSLPTLPSEVAEAIQAQHGPLERVVRVTLLTPALFKQGATPTELLRAPEGRRHELIAWVVGRPQAISGWDLAQGQPKPHQRMAPAGSTYWLRLSEGTDPVQWAKDHFMTSISDQPSDRNTGFGLCVIGGA